MNHQKDEPFTNDFTLSSLWWLKTSKRFYGDDTGLLDEGYFVISQNECLKLLNDCENHNDINGDDHEWDNLFDRIGDNLEELSSLIKQ